MEIVLGLAAYAIAALVYFRGYFPLGVLLGTGFWITMAQAMLAHASMGAAWASIVLLIAFPASFLGVHAYDARRGVFLIPTIYAIPFAFLTGALLWTCAVIAWAF